MIPLPASAARLSRGQAACFLLAGVVLAVAIGLGGVRRFEPIVRLDDAILDALMRATATHEPARDTVVVDIDDVSLSAIGQWPWPRYRLAALIERIAAERPAAIALDILLPEADRASLADLQKTFKRDFGIDVAISGVPDGLLDNDGYLAQQMTQADVVGARYFYFDHATPEARPARPGVGFKGVLDHLVLDKAPGVLDNVEAIASQTRTSGFVNMRLDDDNVLRRLPLLIEYNGLVYPSLALAATMRAAGVPSAEVVAGRDGASLVIGQHTVPVDRRGYALLRFDGPPANYPSVPAVHVLAGRNDSLDLRGKIVFIGSSAVGLNDHHLTATSPSFSGAKIQRCWRRTSWRDVRCACRTGAGAARCCSACCSPWGSASVHGGAELGGLCGGHLVGRPSRSPRSPTAASPGWTVPARGSPQAGVVLRAGDGVRHALRDHHAMPSAGASSWRTRGKSPSSRWRPSPKRATRKPAGTSNAPSITCVRSRTNSAARATTRRS